MTSAVVVSKGELLLVANHDFIVLMPALIATSFLPTSKAPCKLSQKSTFVCLNSYCIHLYIGSKRVVMIRRFVLCTWLV